MVDERTKAQKDALEQRIEALKQGEETIHHSDEHYSQAHLAWRMVIELVAGIAIGFGIGYGLDTFFETLPIFMIIFVLLGFVAGVRTMMRSANEVQKDMVAKAAEETEE
jgi:ATP synthase protein I